MGKYERSIHEKSLILPSKCNHRLDDDDNKKKKNVIGINFTIVEQKKKFVVTMIIRNNKLFNYETGMFLFLKTKFIENSEFI